jgi:hypothetical protein
MCLYCCFLLSSPPPRQIPSYPSRIYTSALAAASCIGVLLGHGSRTRGLVAGIATPGDGGVRGEGRHPNPSGDVGT